jgi:hypothetical protein
MASISYNDKTLGGMVPAHRWNEDRVASALRIVEREALRDIGDISCERACINAVSLIWSRALTDIEIEQAGLVGVCARDLAGFPLRILFERGDETALSTRPCNDPHIEVRGMPLLIGCGRCLSCQAREELDAIP